MRNKHLGFVFQKYHLIPQYTVLQNVILPLLIRGIPRDRAERLAMERIRRMRLEDRVRHKPSELSGGQQQRVAIARALVASPSLLLADEPTGVLDSATGAEILALFRELNEAGNTIIMITHDPAVAALAGTPRADWHRRQASPGRSRARVPISPWDPSILSRG